MARPTSSWVKVVDDDGVLHVGDELVVESSADGVVTCYGSDPSTDEVVWAQSFIGSKPEYQATVGYSQNWQANPIPLVGHCVLYQSRKGRVVEVASSENFELLP